MDTPSMIVRPSIILLQPLKSERERNAQNAKIDIIEAISDHQVVVCHHVGASIVLDWHFIGA